MKDSNINGATKPEFVNKANNVWVYFQSCNKLADYIKEVEICTGQQDVEMSPEADPSSSDNKEQREDTDQDMEDFVTPESKWKSDALGHKGRTFARVEEHKHEEDNQNQQSGAKSEPLANDKDNLLCNEESLNEIKHFLTTNKKYMKSTRLSHLNSLTALFGHLGCGKDKIKQDRLQPQIIFHSPYWPLPPNISRIKYIESNKSNSPCFNNKGCSNWDQDESNQEYSSWHDPNWKHQKALCRVYDEEGKPVPFDQVCASHPCYLVVPPTPESKMNQSLLQQSTPEGAYVEAIRNEQTEVIDESPTLAPKKLDMQKILSDTETVTKSRTRNKNVLRLKTTPLESNFKIDNKRKRKEKRHKLANSKCSVDTGKLFLGFSCR
jgi:hypothetical protein